MARPTTYTDGVMGMVAHDGMESSATLLYSPRIQDAVGVSSTYLRHDDAWMHGINYNRLLKRINGEGSQANFYLLSGVGMAQRADHRDAAAWGGVAADWESRRYFVGYENRAIISGLIDEAYMQRARIGIAPYLVNYNKPQPWLMLQIDHRPQGAKDIVVTPLVRVFTSRLLGEAGISSEGDVLFNLTGNF